MSIKGIVLLESGPGRDALKKHCRPIIKVRYFEALVEAELEQLGKRKRLGIWQKFDEILNEAIGTDPES
jgi:hypothetical protein